MRGESRGTKGKYGGGHSMHLGPTNGAVEKNSGSEETERRIAGPSLREKCARAKNATRGAYMQGLSATASCGTVAGHDPKTDLETRPGGVGTIKWA